MISAAEVARTHAFLARRFQWRTPLDPVGIAAALREAEALAAGNTDDEPATLLLALMRRPMDLADAWERLPLILVENLLRHRGHTIRLDPKDPEIRDLRMRCVTRDPAQRATLDDVRAFLAARLIP
ncbi:Hypothetical protein A7982_09379 [Minicystis rosea]|nr:Hypothetical protein A7982_09379 [Minicystis rosea]